MRTEKYFPPANCDNVAVSRFISVTYSHVRNRSEVGMNASGFQVSTSVLKVTGAGTSTVLVGLQTALVLVGPMISFPLLLVS